MAEVTISGLTAGTPPYSADTLVVLSVPSGGGYISRSAQISDLFAVKGLFQTAYDMVLSAGSVSAIQGMKISNATDAFVNLSVVANRAAGGNRSIIEQDSFGDINTHIFARANGTPAVPTALVANDYIQHITASGYDGAAYQSGADIVAQAAENWDGSHKAATLGLRTVDLTSETLLLRLGITGNGDTQLSNGALLQTKSVSVPLTGDTLTMAQWERARAINPAGTLAALTVKLPPSPHDGQMAGFGSSQIITSLTVEDSAGTAGNVIGAPSTLSVAGQGRTFVFQSSDSKWYVCG